MADGGRVAGEIERAFRHVGFQRDWSATPTLRYRGSLKCHNTVVELVVDVPDLDFVRPPDIRVNDLSSLPSKVLPHIFGGDGGLCYMQRNVTTLDRYDPCGTILFCLEQAKRTLEDAISGRSERDIAAEFFAYWGNFGYVDLPKSFTGSSAVQTILAVRENATFPDTLIVTEKGDLPVALRRRHSALVGNAPIISRTCYVMHVPILLTVGRDKDRWPPKTLSALLGWLAGYATQFVELLTRAILEGGKDWLVVLRAPNGDFLVEVKLPPAFDTVEFTETRRGTLPDWLISKKPETVDVVRYTGWPISSDYIFGRNMGEMINLANKRIMLIGCGTIGSLLAQQLAQSGAGVGDRGELMLVDDDFLSAANIGRHLLGITYIGEHKSEGCRRFLLDSLPHVNIRATMRNAADLRPLMPRYDLIIDATGEDAFSIALNQWAVDAAPKFPPVIFTWLLGNGVGTQSFFYDGDRTQSCLKCLQPVMNEPARFEMAKDETRFGRTLACGDAGYIPYPVSRSSQAASLALEMALAWVRKDLRHRLMHRVLDFEHAKSFRDNNPDPSPRCPACRGS